MLSLFNKLVGFFKIEKNNYMLSFQALRCECNCSDIVKLLIFFKLPVLLVRLEKNDFINHEIFSFISKQYISKINKKVLY